ncbi:MAG: LacI family transcriptional regulator [Calditrichaeota bacterium]|nr:LacI family transcriptional regulator [Calditrichota bacterium]
MPTIKDIARIANVSVSTVSKALNLRADVSEETRRKILDIAKELNYDISKIKKETLFNKTKNAGVIFCREEKPLSLNPFYSRVLEGIEGELAINNYNLVLHLLPNQVDISVPQLLANQKVDGTILVGVFSKDFIERIKKIELPVVLIDPKIYVENVTQVLIDNEHGAYTATQYLIQKGHKRIGFISGQLERLSFYQRFTGYKKALEYHNIEFDENLVQTGYLEEGYGHTKKLLNLNNPPTAIFSANDINAIYGYQAVKEAGLQIPDDVSIIGFDDIELARMATPQLTTIRVYKEEMGSIAVRLLLQQINGEFTRPVTTLVPTKLVERDSVKTI